jgi:transcriptional regulator with GAF, ATPase, and Fis domain
MALPTDLDWTKLLGLGAVVEVEDLVARRWNLGLGYLDEGGEHHVAPSIRGPVPHVNPSNIIDSSKQVIDAPQGSLADMAADLRTQWARPGPASFIHSCQSRGLEILAPIAVGGALVGGLRCGPYRLKGGAGPDRLGTGALLPLLGQRELAFVQELLVEAAAAISQFLQQSRGESAEPELREHYEGTLGSSQAMQALYALLDKVVAADTTVLITGENGTGKELVAQAIHNKSSRRGERFIVHNCSAFNDNLIDSELFGHVRGAFTGAVSDKQGLFEVADRGTFFLDEIGDMSPTLQVKILRVLQEGTFTSVGGTDTKHVDVRILAATNRDLPAMVEQGTFREDLYYRINVINLELPALREREGDIEQLASHFLGKHGGQGKEINAECLALLKRYQWPGNVRELENEMERLAVLAGDSKELGPELVSNRIRKALCAIPFLPAPVRGSLPDAIRDLEKRMIYDALIENSWNKTRAASQLKVSRRNLIRLVQKYEIDKEREPRVPS